MSRAGKPAADSPQACARALGLKVPGGEYLTWASLVQPAFNLYWIKRVAASRPVKDVAA